jgi:hypothetical protein
VYAVVWTPDGKRLVSGSFDKSIKVWDANSGDLVREIKPGTDRPPLPPAVRLAGPGAIGAAAGVVLNEPPPAGHHDQVLTLAVSKDGTRLASGSSDRTIKLWDLATGRLIHDFPNPDLKPAVAGLPHPSHHGFVNGVRFTADGKRLVSAGNSPRNYGYIAVWSVADGKRITFDVTPTGPIHAVEIVSDDTLLLACGPKARGRSESDAILARLPRG